MPRETINPQEDAVGALREIRAEQHRQNIIMSGLSRAQETVSDEIASVRERVRRVEETTRAQQEALSESIRNSAQFQEAITAHVDATHRKVEASLDGQNVELAAQSKKLDILITADEQRIQREKIVQDLAEQTYRRIKVWKDAIGLIGGIVGLLGTIVGVLFWALSKGK